MCLPDFFLRENSPLILILKAKNMMAIFVTVDFSIIGKPTEQSSTYRAEASKAVDGKGLTSTANFDCTHTSKWKFFFQD